MPSLLASSQLTPSVQVSSPRSFDDQLLDEVGIGAGSHVLVLGGRRTELMGGLIRRGCLAATSLRQGEKPEADAFDVVVAPCVTPGGDLDRIVHCAWRALMPGGEFVACLTDACSGPAGLELQRRLRLHGFDVVGTRPFQGTWLLRATLAESKTAVRHG